MLAMALVAVACTDDPGPTIPDPVVTTPATPAPIAPAPTPTEVAPSPGATPDTRRIFADCNNVTGVCTFKTGESRAFNVSGKCTEPAQNAPVHGTWNGTVVDGDTVHASAVCNLIEPYDCKPRQEPVQVDFAQGGRHIGHLGPLWTLKLEQKLSPEECEECVEDPKKVYEKTCGDWNECHEHPSGVHASTTENGCFHEKECVIRQGTDYQCKEDDIETITVEEVEPCPCPPCVDDPQGTLSGSQDRSGFRASAVFEDSGEWTLRISASSHESECTSNQPDYWKRTVKKTLKCDERGSLSTSYGWAGHGSEWWRRVLYRNGAVWDQSECIRNPYN